MDNNILSDEDFGILQFKLLVLSLFILLITWCLYSLEFIARYLYSSEFEWRYINVQRSEFANAIFKDYWT